MLWNGLYERDHRVGACGVDSIMYIGAPLLLTWTKDQLLIPNQIPRIMCIPIYLYDFHSRNRPAPKFLLNTDPGLSLDIWAYWTIFFTPSITFLFSLRTRVLTLPPLSIAAGFRSSLRFEESSSWGLTHRIRCPWSLQSFHLPSLAASSSSWATANLQLSSLASASLFFQLLPSGTSPRWHLPVDVLQSRLSAAFPAFVRLRLLY